jgi:A/G-specific adenine glycosylase
MFAQKSPSGDFCYDARVKKLLKELKTFYRKEGRNHLPWRTTRDPYKVLVSEVMLQQTQVERVIPFYKKFIKKFPTVRALTTSRLPQVLLLWQGLGYNRRAKFLHEAAKTILRSHGGSVPRTAGELETLPGVGPYTARAVAAFAFNAPEVFIETNIRTVFMHACAPGRRKISDKELAPLVQKALADSRMQPRDFYAALMDYGSYLKASGVRLNPRSTHYVKQSAFEGSARQLRGALLRSVLQRPATAAELTKNLSRNRGEVERELRRLQKDGLLRRGGYRYHPAD